jgi:SP family general alpha glucoside:H+ symporter-like MFS transporter
MQSKTSEISPETVEHDREKSLSDHRVTEKEISEDARLATTKEHQLSLRQGLRAYRKAIIWSILLSSAVIMEGYDTILVCITLSTCLLLC